MTVAMRGAGGRGPRPNAHHACDLFPVTPAIVVPQPPWVPIVHVNMGS